jgi:hypothetical protein
VKKVKFQISISLNHHLATSECTVPEQASLHTLLSSLARTVACVDVFIYHTEAMLTIDGPHGVGAIAMGPVEASFNYTRNVVLSPTSPSLYYTPHPQKDYHPPYARPDQTMAPPRLPRPEADARGRRGTTHQAGFQAINHNGLTTE